MALRIAAAYQTVSTEAIRVITGIPLNDLLAKEMKRIYNSRNTEPDRAETRKMANEEVISEWQRRWDVASNGRWTYRLIKNISEFYKRGMEK